MKSVVIAATCFLGYSAAQGSIEKDAEWTVNDLSAASTPGTSGSLTTQYVSSYYLYPCSFLLSV